MQDTSKRVRIVEVGGVVVFIPYNDVVETLQQQLQTSAPASPASPTPGTYGLRSAQLQTIFDNFYTTTIATYRPVEQVYFGYRFLTLPMIEEKRVGIMILAKNIEDFTVEHIPDFERILDTAVVEWTICDAFAVRVIGPLIKKNDQFSLRVCAWKDSGKTWKMRAACIAFGTLAKVGAMVEESIGVCAACVRCSERFVQLGVGCLLRELSILFPDRVVQFITDNYRFFSREGLRYSIDKLNAPTRKQILSIGKKRSTPPPPQQPQQQHQCVAPVQQIQPVAPQFHYNYVHQNMQSYAVPQPVYMQQTEMNPPYFKQANPTYDLQMHAYQYSTPQPEENDD